MVNQNKMWGKLRRKIQQTKHPEEPDGGKELALDHGQVMTKWDGSSGEFAVKKNLVDSNSFLFADRQDDCKCSPLLHFQKHFFGAFRSKKLPEDCREQISGNERTTERKMSLKNKVLDSKDIYHSFSEAEHFNGHSAGKVDGDGNNRLTGKQCNGLCYKEIIRESLVTDGVELEMANDDSVIKRTDVREILDDTPLLLEGVKLSPPKLKRRERGIVQEPYNSEKSRLSTTDLDSSAFLDPVLKDLSNVTEDKTLCVSAKVNLELSSEHRIFDADKSGVDCSSKVQIYKSDDKEESMDSGHHLSEGDVEKGHSSPDLDPDEFDGRESGYTTLDDVQPLPFEPFLHSYNVNLIDNFCQQCSESYLSDAYKEYISSLPTDLSVCNVSITNCCSTVPTSCRFSNSSELYPLVYPNVNSENSQQWEHVDYVPADISVSKIYEDASNSGVNDAYASVPRSCIAKSEENCADDAVASYEDQTMMEKRTETKPTNRSLRLENLECCSLGGVNFVKCREAVSGESYPEADSIVLVGLDSDDGETLPPLPERNYELCISSVESGTKLVEDPSLKCGETKEQIHMTWEELMREAKCLGIPLNGPHLEKSSLYSDSVLTVQSTLPDPDVTEKCPKVRCSCECFGQNVNQVSTNKNETKKSSPFKDKFRLPNPFSRKNKIDRNESCIENDIHYHSYSHNTSTKSKKPVFRHHSAVDIQKRCLPRPPSGDQQNDCSSAFDQIVCGGVKIPLKSGTHRMAVSLHLPVSDEDLISRSWGSSSNIPHGLTVNDSVGRSRRGFSDSSQWQNSACSSMLPTALHLDSSSSDNTNINADFIQSFSKLKDCGWYWGPLGWENAEAKLEDKPDGSFLVRDSSDDRYILSLSFRSQNMTHHTRIEHYKGMFSFYSQPKSHGASTIVEFIEKAMEHSRSGKFLYFLRPRAPGLPPAPVQLLFPISRLRNMHSLQHMCRFLILRHVRRDLIDWLPIPPRLKEYLKQTQYYIEYSDCDSMGHQYFSKEW